MKKNNHVDLFIAEHILERLKEAFENFSNDDFNKAMLSKIENLNTEDLMRITGLKKSMIHKYKNGENLPPLDKAVLIEDAFDIPPRYWVLNRKHKKI